MEHLAENRFTITKSLFYEGMLRISREGYGKAAGKAMLVFLGMWLALLVFTVTTGGNLSQTMSYLILVALIGLWLCILMPRSNARRAWRTLEARHGDSLERITRFYTDHLEIEGEGVAKTVFYSDILQIRQSRRLLILVCQDKAGILLALDGFTGTNPQQVKALIEGAKDKE